MSRYDVYLARLHGLLDGCYVASTLARNISIIWQLTYFEDDNHTDSYIIATGLVLIGLINLRSMSLQEEKWQKYEDEKLAGYPIELEKYEKQITWDSYYQMSRSFFSGAKNFFNVVILFFLMAGTSINITAFSITFLFAILNAFYHQQKTKSSIIRQMIKEDYERKNTDLSPSTQRTLTPLENDLLNEIPSNPAILFVMFDGIVDGAYLVSSLARLSTLILKNLLDSERYEASFALTNAHIIAIISVFMIFNTYWAVYSKAAHEVQWYNFKEGPENEGADSKNTETVMLGQAKTTPRNFFEAFTYVREFVVGFKNPFTIASLIVGMAGASLTNPALIAPLTIFCSFYAAYLMARRYQNNVRKSYRLEQAKCIVPTDEPSPSRYSDTADGTPEQDSVAEAPVPAPSFDYT